MIFVCMAHLILLVCFRIEANRFLRVRINGGARSARLRQESVYCSQYATDITILLFAEVFGLE